MKKWISLLLIAALLCPCAALAAGFTSDAQAINAACQSVVKLDAYDEEDRLIASGSGFAAFDAGCLVTDCRLLAGAARLQATDDTGTVYALKSALCTDEAVGAAILLFDGETALTPLRLSEEKTVYRGSPVAAICSPKGYANNVSTGNVSAVTTDENGLTRIRFNAPVSAGGAGGALMNDEGEVIGMIGDPAPSAQNANTAVSIAHIIGLYEAHKGDEPIPLSAAAAGGAAQTQAREFTLKNSAGFAMSEVYLYPDGAAAWGNARNTSGWVQREASLTVVLSDEELSARTTWTFNFCFYYNGWPYYFEYTGLRLKDILGRTLVVTMTPGKVIEITIE